MPVRIALVSLSAAVLAMSAAAAGPAPPFPELAFTVTLRNQFASSALCVGPAADLGQARRLTRLGWFYDAAWSPDGARVAISGGKHRRSSTHAIRVENADGTGLHVVSRTRLRTEDDANPSWSPGGTRIVFSRYVYFGSGTDYRRHGLWVVTLQTGVEQQIFNGVAPAAWAPSGELIAAVARFGSTAELVLVRPDGQVESRSPLPFLGDFDDGVSWSPDGTRLAIGGGAVVNRAGRLVGRYAPPSTNDAVSRLPSWSPDGASIVFARSGTASNARTNIRTLLNADLYLGSPAGGAEVPLTRTPLVNETAPEWRPGSSTAAAGTPQTCLLTGTGGRDVLRGTSADDLVDGGPGNDVLDGGGGDDLLAGGPGNDRLRGGAGHDVLLGLAGNDRLEARDGTWDQVLGGSGRDYARVDRKRDQVVGVERVR